MSERSAKGRKPRDREATIRSLLSAARELLERDGALAGLNLREVADRAGVNRGQIYQYFGSRQELLRAAIADVNWRDKEHHLTLRDLPFPDRREDIFRNALAHSGAIKLEALLSLDGATDVQLFPFLDLTLDDMVEYQKRGELPEDIDLVALHFMSASAYLGYCVFRETFSADSGIGASELDERVTAVYKRFFVALANESQSARTIKRSRTTKR